MNTCNLTDLNYCTVDLAQAIWGGMRELHTALPLGSAGRALAEAEDSDGSQSYVLKRLFSEAANGLAFTKFPSSLLEASCLIALSAQISWKSGVRTSRTINAQ